MCIMHIPCNVPLPLHYVTRPRVVYWDMTGVVRFAVIGGELRRLQQCRHRNILTVFRITDNNVRTVNLLRMQPHIARLRNLAQKQIVRLAVPADIHLKPVRRGVFSEGPIAARLLLSVMLTRPEIPVRDKFLAKLLERVQCFRRFKFGCFQLQHRRRCFHLGNELQDTRTSPFRLCIFLEIRLCVIGRALLRIQRNRERFQVRAVVILQFYLRLPAGNAMQIREEEFALYAIILRFFCACQICLQPLRFPLERCALFIQRLRERAPFRCHRLFQRYRIVVGAECLAHRVKRSGGGIGELMQRHRRCCNWLCSIKQQPREDVARVKIGDNLQIRSPERHLFCPREDFLRERRTEPIDVVKQPAPSHLRETFDDGSEARCIKCQRRCLLLLRRQAVGFTRQDFPVPTLRFVNVLETLQNPVVCRINQDNVAMFPHKFREDCLRRWLNQFIGYRLDGDFQNPIPAELRNFGDSPASEMRREEIGEVGLLLSRRRPLDEMRTRMHRMRRERQPMRLNPANNLERKSRRVCLFNMPDGTT